MKSIKIIELNLRNFKGIKDLKITPNGRDTFIYGRNEAGKTSIMDAFIWLLFDKDSSNKSNFSIKTLDKEGNPIHMLEHEVVAKLDIDGAEVELQKVYKEKWTKKRGQAESELTGHTTDYFINGVPKKKSEYTDYLSGIIDEEMFKILTNPLHFNENLRWEQRREVALGICGDIEDSEVIRQDESLQVIEDLLKQKSIEDLKAEMTARRKKLNDELKSIPVRIDELSREDLDIDIEGITSKKRELSDKLQELRSSESTDNKFRIRRIRGSIGILENDLKEIERTHTFGLRESLDQLFEDRNNIAKRQRELKDKIFLLESDISMSRAEKTELEKKIEKLREEFKDLKVQEFNDKDTVCPTCNQSLPPEDVAGMVESFETKKSKRLHEINESGKEKKQKLDDLTKKITDMEIELKDEKEDLEMVQGIIKAKIEEIQKINDELDGFDPSGLPEYKAIQAKISDLEGEIDKIQSLVDGEIEKVEQINSLESQIAGLDRELAKVDLAEKNRKRIQELKDRERELAQMVADTEKLEFLCGQFVIAKANLLEEKLNSKFEMVKFKLFDIQVNGALNETFVTTYKGVPFTDLNDAAKINSGLDIIKTLSDEYQACPPIFLDNREAVNEIPSMEAQVINLVVSWDKTLKVDNGEQWEMLKPIKEAS